MALTGNKFTDLGEIAQVYAGVLDTFLVAPLVGPQCSKRIVTGVFTLDAGVVRDSCFSLLVSKGLGLGIVVGGSIVKVPQILKIFNSGSARGISLVSYVLETLAYVITLSYNLRRDNPFSTYGEVAFITLQNVIILLMLTFYSKKYVSLVGVTAFFAAATYALNSDLLPDSLLVSLQWAAIVISTVSKLPQIYTNFANGDTGALSAITVALQFVGSAARIFTTLREVKDQVILVSFIMATALNGILFGQVLLLGGGKGAAKKKGSAAKNAAKKAKSASKKD
ncbi:hypothetical protein HDU78_009661 [Chytriomyces hyalinus]|nr:hypothetical protein HDU78_009661 [Chytriomyces hyalinus]KAJ3244019.1 hypothetical protein HDU77_010088 [Chytriomyces hyalinus]